MSATRRLFFALWPDDHIRHALLHWQTHNLSNAVRWQHRDDLHITLHFLGQVDGDRLEEVAAVGAKHQSASFSLVLDEIDYWSKPRVLCAMPSSVPALLTELHAALGEGLESIGFAAESRPYRPHVTLARKVGADETFGPLSSLTWSVKELALVESRPGNAPHYHPLRRWLLA